MQIETLAELYSVDNNDKGMEDLLIEIVCLDNETLLNLFVKVQDPLYTRQNKWKDQHNQSEWLKTHALAQA